MQHREKRRARTCKRMSGARDGEYDGGGGTASGKADHFHDADDKVFAAGQGLVVEGVAVLGATVLQGAVDEQPHAVPAASGERERSSHHGVVHNGRLRNNPPKTTVTQ